MSEQVLKLKQDAESKKLGLQIRKVYKSVIRIIVCAKQKRPRKAVLMCSAIQNSDILQYLPRTAAFMRHVSYHTATGKFQKSSYKVLTKLAALPLAELERYVKQINVLFPPKSGREPTKRRVGFVFNAISDLEQVKHLIGKEKKDEPADTVIVDGMSKKVKSHKSKKNKKSKKSSTVGNTEVDQDDADVAAGIESKSISKDDELVLKTLGKEKQDIDIEYGECALVKRGVVMLQTHIPPNIWKRVHTKYGLDIVAHQYVTAVFQPVLAAPLEVGGILQTPEQTLHAAQAYLAIYNRSMKDMDARLEIVGRPRRSNSSSHLWFLCLPVCVTHFFGFKFGSWDFATPTSARTAVEVGDAALVNT